MGRGLRRSFRARDKDGSPDSGVPTTRGGHDGRGDDDGRTTTISFGRRSGFFEVRDDGEIDGTVEAVRLNFFGV